MGAAGQAILLAVFVLASSIWVGGYLTIAVVARAATATLPPAGRVAFFRALGRGYLWLGGGALAVALVTGAVLVRDHRFDALLVVTVAAAGLLVVLLAIAVGQARRMTRLRRRALEPDVTPDLDIRIARGARAAGILRGVLGLLTLALVVLGAFLAGR
jgi:uncharacterized membrane protein